MLHGIMFLTLILAQYAVSPWSRCIRVTWHNVFQKYTYFCFYIKQISKIERKKFHQDISEVQVQAENEREQAYMPLPAVDRI